MHKVRAASYLRRTISEPYPRRRPSAIIGVTVARDLVINLVDSNRHRASVVEPAYCCGPSSAAADPLAVSNSWSSDLEGIRLLIAPKRNLALMLFPLGIWSWYRNWGDVLVFSINFAVLIPLASLLGTVTEELALHTGDLAGGLLNATFGNAVEMIFTLQALRANLVDVVQGSLLGSILSNLLLVLGMSFFAGGLFHHVQRFNAKGVTCSTSLLLLACLAIIVPTVAAASSNEDQRILMVSRLTALLVSIIYCLFLIFQLATHLSLFKAAEYDDEEEEDIVNMCSEDDANDGTPQRLEVMTTPTTTTGQTLLMTDQKIITSYQCENFYESKNNDWPTISVFTAIILLGTITLAITASSACLIGSINGVTERSGVPQSFISVILLPVVGNAAEHLTAVTVAVKNKPDLTMGVAIGSSTQVALFLVPFSVLAGWVMQVPMTLAFSYVGAAVLVFSVLLVIGVVQDGATNWFEGAMLMAAYAIVAVVFWYYNPAGSVIITRPP